MSVTTLVAVNGTSILRRLDRVFAATTAIFFVLILVVPKQAAASLTFTLDSILFITPFLALSVAVAAVSKATGLDQQIAVAFEGRPVTMIVLAAVFGALSPFCSCGVIPIIAGLLAAGVPLAPVMAFWVASPLMDPEMFILMSAVFPMPFVLAKTVAAVLLGLVAGFATHGLSLRGLFANPLKHAYSRCAQSCSPKTRDLQWDFWRSRSRRAAFLAETRDTGWFLLKWLTLAFIIESLMIAYIPADMVSAWLGGGRWWTVPASVLVGVPAYLNGYAAIPTVSSLIDLGMSQAGALAFMIAGGVTSIPAAMSVFALVRAPIFLWYLTLALAGSVMVGYGYQALLQLIA
ncbi:MAG: permease [Acidiferrobacterales bacterium]